MHANMVHYAQIEYLGDDREELMKASATANNGSDNIMIVTIVRSGRWQKMLFQRRILKCEWLSCSKQRRFTVPSSVQPATDRGRLTLQTFAWKALPEQGSLWKVSRFNRKKSVVDFSLCSFFFYSNKSCLTPHYAPTLLGMADAIMFSDESNE